MTTSLETKLILLQELEGRVKSVKASIKAEWASEAIPGDRKTAAVKVDGKPLKLGSVTYTNGRSGYKVTDRAAFTEWVKANQPDAIEVTESVKPWMEKTITDAEGFNPIDGEEVPGVTLVEGAPYATVRPDKAAGENIEHLMQSGVLSWNEVLELEA